MKKRRILKLFLIILGTILLLILLAIFLLFLYYRPNENTVLKHIKNHPEQSSILLVRNDTVIAAQEINRVMPLASTVKIMVAIEYALQAAQGKLDADENVPVDSLNKYYVVNTDGGAHAAWLETIPVNNITIRDVAIGMIQYSSNANTEWLQQKLGLNNINKLSDSLNLKSHQEIYYLAASLFVAKELFPNLKGKELIEKMQRTKQTDYLLAIENAHHKLRADTTYKNTLGDMKMDLQKIWSDRLIGASVAAYSRLMKLLNSKTFFDSATHKYLDECMEGLMQNPGNQSWLKHGGMKGGSTAFVLTYAVYATDYKGNKTELVYFFNNLDVVESIRLEISMNEFELKILQDPKFREKVKTSLQNLN